jgi:hypothetical protein
MKRQRLEPPFTRPKTSSTLRATARPQAGKGRAIAKRRWILLPEPASLTNLQGFVSDAG